MLALTINANMTTQTVEVAGHIRTLYAAIPLVTGVFLVVGLGLVFNLTKEDSERITKDLASRRPTE
jgi:Na+/melibiose symporter-like transporter